METYMASFILMMISVTFSLLLNLMQGHGGLLSAKMQRKVRVYCKTAPPITMTIAGILLLTASFTFLNLAIVVIAIITYSYSSVIAWKQFLSQEDTSRLNNHRKIASFIANVLTILLGYSTLMLSIQ